MQGQAGRSSGAGAPSTDAAAAPFAHALELAVGRGDDVAVIAVVERWIETGAAPASARIAEARALLRLCLADRAWVRLREVTENEPDHIEALVLLGEMFVARGWPQRAQRLVERLDQLGQRGAAVDQLRRGAQAPARQPPADAREIERAGDPTALLALGEAFLLSGNLIRAQALLERVARSGAHEARVSALLWGIRGDFIDRNAPPDPRLGLRSPGPAQTPAPFGGFLPMGVSMGAESEAQDHETAEASRHGGLLDADAAAFPHLFRGGAPAGAELGRDDEVTMAAVLAQASELGDAPPRENTDPDAIRPRESGDTQIMQVIQSGAGRKLGAVDGPVHARASAAPGANLHKTLDLRAWQQEMGVSPAAAETDWNADEDDAEDDDDLVVLTRAPGASPATSSAPAPAPERRTPVEVVNRPSPAPPPAAARPRLRASEDVAAEPTPTTAPPPAARVAPPPSSTTSAAVEDLPVDAPARRFAWPALVLIGALMGVVILGGAFAALRFRGGAGVDSTTAVVARGEPEVLDALAVELGAAAQGRTASPAAAELALIEAFRFAVLDADPRRGAAATLGLQQASADHPLRGTAAALLRLGEGDPAGAAALLPEAATDRVSAALRAHLLLQTGGSGAQAVAALGPAEAGEVGWRAAIRAEAMAAAGQTAEARAMVEAGAADPWLALVYGGAPWSDATGAQRVAVLSAVRDRPGAPQRSGAAAVALARAHAA